MPPKNAAGGGQGAPDAGRVALLSMSGMSAADCYAFFQAQVPGLKSVEKEWLENGVTGRMLVAIDPFSFLSETAKEFPTLGVSTRTKLFDAVKTKMAIDFAKNTATVQVVAEPIGQAWAVATADALPPVVLNRFNSSNEDKGPPVHRTPAKPFTFGGLMTPQTLRFPAPHPAQMPSLVGQQAAPASAAANSFAQMPALAGQQANTATAPSGATAQFRIPPPPPALSSAVGVSKSAQMPALAGQQSASKQQSDVGQSDSVQELDSASDFDYSFRPKKPWIKAKELRDAKVQEVVDTRFPPGFFEINIAKEMEAAIADRKDKGGIMAYPNSAPVQWPVLEIFEKEEYTAHRAKFYDCVQSSLESGMFRSFKSTLSFNCRLVMFPAFELNHDSYRELPDSEFMEFCDVHFGPKNARTALAALDAIKMETHRDKLHSQSSFVRKLDLVKIAFELAVNDMVKCHSYWPSDPSDKEFGVVTMKMLMDKFLSIFPKPNPRGAPISVQMDTARRFLDLNKETLFNNLNKRLRLVFSDKDQEVRDGGAYSTVPDKDTKDSDRSERNSGQSLRQGQRPPRGDSNHYRGGGGSFQNDAAPHRGGSDSARGGYSKVSKPVSRGGSQGREARGVSKSVPGHKRCPGCGANNNHWGLGFTKNSCPLFGHALAKKGSYAWRNSDDEPPVRIDTDEYKRLLQSNPRIREEWTKAKTAKRTRVSALSCLTDAGDVGGQSDNDAVDDDLDEVSDEDKSDAYIVLSNWGSNDCSVAAIHTATLSEIGHERQFFGVSRFAQNNAFAAKTLLDPGAEINIISPQYANRCAILRKHMCVEIYQGKRKQTTVDEVVLCPFELQSRNNTWETHTLWFAVSDMGYNVLLGRRFCRENGFTTFDERLKSFDAHENAVDSASVSALASTPPSLRASTFRLRFQREAAPEGKARFKRSPRCIVATIIDDAHAFIHRSLLNEGRAFSALKQIEVDTSNGNNRVQLEFDFESYSRGNPIPRQTAWFEISDDATKQGVFLPLEFVTKLGIAASLPSAVDDASVAATVVTDIRGPRAESNEVSTREHGPIRFRGMHESVIKADQQKLDARYVSFHPISNYKLQRKADPPLSMNDRKDHHNFLCNRDFKGERLAIESAFNAANTATLCMKKERQLKSMLSAISSKPLNIRPVARVHKPVSDAADIFTFESELAAFAAEVIDEENDIQLDALMAMQKIPYFHGLDEQAARAALQRVVALIEPSQVGQTDSVAVQQAHLATASEVPIRQPHSYKPGDYVVITGASNRTEFNGQRARLYSKEELPGSWLIRVLGKNHGLWRCADKKFSPLSDSEQVRSTPSSANAGFDDVGIDASGQPDIDLKNIVHRQFGAAYSEDLTRRIEHLKAQFPSVFTNDVTEPCEFEPMRINLIPNAILPSKARFYRNTPKMREEIRRQIQEQLQWGVVRKCVTPYVSDVLLVKRPHMPGKFRFVVSYLKLNEATVKEQLIMPDPKSQHERLAGNRIFGALDFSSYYRQIRLHEESQLLTGFASDEGTYCYTRVPMGITGACMYAQKVLQDALAADPVLGPLGIKNYFDDLPFGASTEDDFMRILEALLHFCVKWKLKVNPDKTILGVTSITHVGFVVSEQGVSIDPERNRDIRELTAPRSIKKVQSVLGIFNYVRNFVPNFSDRAKFLTDKLAAVPVTRVGLKRPAPVATSALSAKLNTNAMKVDKAVPKFVWTTDDDRRFEELKECILNAPMLAQLDYSKPIFIRCDASRFGAGAVLFQYDDRGYENVVCYASRKFLPAERNWSTFSQEASTVVWALERFAEYTQGYHTIVECDHRNISFVKKSAMPQLARWRLRLQDMDFSVRFLAGSGNQTADGLSRQHVDDVEVELHDVIPECALSEAGPNTSSQFADISAIEAVVFQAELAPVSTRAQQISATRDPAVLQDNSDVPGADEDEIAAESDSSSSDSDEDELSGDDTAPVFGVNGEILDEAGLPIATREQQPAHLVIPVLDAAAEFHSVHNDLLGHAGTYVTLQRALRNDRSWGTRKQMLADIDAFIQGCPSCQKMRKRSSRSHVDRHTISGSPFAELSIDILKLPKPDALGMQYVVVVVDSFSHWTSLVAVRNKSAFDAARALMHVIGNFGAPLRIRSDGGKEFVGSVLIGLSRLMGASNHVVLPYTPTANGIVERANRSVLERLREMIFSKRLVRHTEHQWSDLLPMVQRSINASIHSATGTSPARILFGDNLDLDRCLLTRAPDARELDMSSYVDALTWNRRVILEEADLFQSKLCDKVIAKANASQRVKRGANWVPAPIKELAVGDWVLVKPQPNYPLNKLAPRWLGPFQIESCAADSKIVSVFDSLKNKRRQFMRRELELFDISMMADVEGLTKVAESDGFEFPVESIMGVSLVNEGGVGSNPVQLSPDFVRGQRRKTSFQFLIKWVGYEEPTWVDYKTACRLVQFPGYVTFFPGLRMD